MVRRSLIAGAAAALLVSCQGNVDCGACDFPAPVAHVLIDDPPPAFTLSLCLDDLPCDVREYRDDCDVERGCIDEFGEDEDGPDWQRVFLDLPEGSVDQAAGTLEGRELRVTLTAPGLTITSTDRLEWWTESPGPCACSDAVGEVEFDASESPARWFTWSRWSWPLL